MLLAYSSCARGTVRRQACGVHLSSLDSFDCIGGGKPVFCRVCAGVDLTGFLAVLNYRGIRWSASFKTGRRESCSFLFLLLGSAPIEHLPIFIRRFARLPSYQSAYAQIVPYFMTGFDRA